MFSPDNRWRGVEVAGWTALAVGLLSVYLFTLATSSAGSAEAAPVLLYPYFAAASVFSTVCVWILLAARVGVPASLLPETDFERAKRWSMGVLVGLTVLVSVGAGFAGPQGVNAVRNINGYLFGSTNRLGMPFALASAFGNALALATLVYLGTLCNAIVLAASGRAATGECVGDSALRIRQLGHLLQRYLIMASALAVTSTLTLYLLFGVAAELEPPAATPATQAAELTMRCAPVAEQFSCELKAAAAPKKAPRAHAAAYMALVCGLSFTGVLFVLFASCSSALDDRSLELAADAHAQDRAGFSVKSFLERYGLAEHGTSGLVLQALALVAPAMTGLLTLITQ